MNKPGDFSEILAGSFASLRPLSAEVLAELSRHYELLTRWNKSLNLTSIRGVEEAVLRHYCESLFLGIHLPATAVSLLDVGSGAGFPGIPLAVLRRACSVTLAESHQRKAVFLREATRHLPNVRVSSRRAEEIEGAFDWVVSRAVRWPDVLRAASGASVGLLLGESDAAEVVCQPGFEWCQPTLLPWGDRRVLVLGTRRPL